MTFRVGQKVVCVRRWNKAPGEGYGDEVGPVVGESYTIRGIGFLAAPIYPDILSVVLEEIVNPTRLYVEGMFEISFAADKFRPVVEHKTDISIFTSMLNPSKVDA